MRVKNLTLLPVVAAMMLLTGCVNTGNDRVLCGIDRAALAGAVLDDGGEKSQREVLFVLDQIKSVCGG